MPKPEESSSKSESSEILAQKIVREHERCKIEGCGPACLNTQLYEAFVCGREIEKSARETRNAALVEALHTVLDHESEDDSEGNIVIRFNCSEWLEIAAALKAATEDK